MFKDAKSLIHDALELPVEERLRVVERLFGGVPEEKIADVWLSEVEKRKAASDAGLVKGIQGKDVIRELRERVWK